MSSVPSTRPFTPSPEQTEFLDWIVDGSGSCVLEAVAGAGKTTTLVEGVRRMAGSVFLGAFNKKMADELKERIQGMPGKMAGTFHSAGFRCLARVVKDPKIDEDKISDLVEAYTVGTELDLVEGFKPAVAQLVSLAKQTGFYVRGLVYEVKRRYWEELVYRHDVDDRLPEDCDIGDLIEAARVVLLQSNEIHDRIDFDDMIYLPLLLNLRFYRNDWVLIDEAQDTNAVRREMAARMLKPGGRLIAVGDPHQAIYGFTGADNDSLTLIRERFRAVTMHLSVSWRCPQRVVAVAREYVSHIRPAPTAPEGVTATVTYKNMLSTVAAGEAVVCRFNAPLIELCFRLIREGKPAKIEGRAIGEGLAALVGRWKVKTLDAFEGRLEKWNLKERAKWEESVRKDAVRKLQTHTDKYETVKILLERGREQGISTVPELQRMILDMFADVGASRSLVVLTSVHRSKGLEWDRVWLIGRGAIMPPQREMQQWQAEQEVNICYVAVTRAKRELIDVLMPTPEDLTKPVIVKKPEEAV